MNLCIRIFFENASRDFEFHWKLTTITGTFNEDQYTFLIICRPFLPKMRSVSDESCWKIQNTQFLFNNFFSPKSAISENTEEYLEPDRTQMTI